MRTRMSAVITAAWLIVPVVSLTLLVGCEEKKEEPVAIAPPQELEPEPFPESQVPRAEPQPAPMVYSTMDRTSAPPPPPAPAPAPAPVVVDTSVPPPPPEAEAPVVTTAKPRQQPRESYERPAPRSGRTYTVKKNDTLQKISQKYYNTTTKWRRIYEANRRVIGSNPDSLKVGQKLVIP